MCRTFGDIESKDPQQGGVPGAVVCDPEIQVLNISPDLDFAFLGCDGIYDVLSNEEINEIIWETIEDFKGGQDLKRTEVKSNYTDLSECLKLAVDNVLKKSLIEGTEDNITAIIVVFRNLLNGSVSDSIRGAKQSSFRTN